MKKCIVHVHQKFYPYQGGSTKRLLTQLMALDKEKFDIYVISQKMDGDKGYEIYNGIKIIRYSKFYEIPKIIFKLDKEKGINILHTHNYRPTLYSYLVNIFLKKSYILEMHSIYKPRNYINKLISKFLIKQSEKIIVLSKESKNMLINDLKIKSDKIEVIYNSVDIDAFKNSNNIDINNIDELSDVNKILADVKSRGINVVGYIGSLRAFQGIDNLVEIINHVNNNKIYFIIIGGTEQEVNNLKKKITNENLYITSFVKSEYVKYFYNNLDILLIPRPTLDSTDSAVPLKPIEAIAAGCLIYSTPVKGMLEVKEILKTNNIKFKSIDEFIKDLNCLCEVNLENDQDLDFSKFSIKRNKEKLEKIYLEFE